MAKGTGALLAAAALCLFGSLPGFTSPLSTRHGAGRSQSLLPRQGYSASDTYGFPGHVFADALADAAAAKKEAVPVMQDMMLLKDVFEEKDPSSKVWNSWNAALKTPMVTNEQRAVEFLKDIKGELKSTVVPKFIMFAAKKKRLDMLRVMALIYVQKMYKAQSVAPVKVESAAPLGDDQIKTIKEKMKQRLDVQDVKIAATINPDLVAGFKLYFNFRDPEKMKEPSSFLDLSFTSHMKESALSAGVAVQ